MNSVSKPTGAPAARNLAQNSSNCWGLLMSIYLIMRTGYVTLLNRVQLNIRHKKHSSSPSGRLGGGGWQRYRRLTLPQSLPKGGKSHLLLSNLMALGQTFLSYFRNFFKKATARGRPVVHSQYHFGSTTKSHSPQYSTNCAPKPALKRTRPSGD